MAIFDDRIGIDVHTESTPLE